MQFHYVVMYDDQTNQWVVDIDTQDLKFENRLNVYDPDNTIYGCDWTNDHIDNQKHEDRLAELLARVNNEQFVVGIN